MLIHRRIQKIQILSRPLARTAEPAGITHVSILRTIEAMYGLSRSGAQQPNAAAAGIGDEQVVTDVFSESP